MPSSKPESSVGRRRLEQGRQFEELAAKFYDNELGFVILERNWRAGHKEIDLIVKRDNLIAFVEVKSSFSKKFGHPADRIDRQKIHNLTDCAQQYIIDHELTGVDLRFDVVTFADGKLEHFPGAFEVDL